MQSLEQVHEIKIGVSSQKEESFREIHRKYKGAPKSMQQIIFGLIKFSIQKCQNLFGRYRKCLKKNT